VLGVIVVVIVVGIIVEVINSVFGVVELLNTVV